MALYTTKDGTALTDNSLNATTATASQGNAINWGNLFGTGANTLANYLGNSSSTGNLVNGEQAGINTQLGVQQQLGNIYGAQTGTGNASFKALGSQLGLNGTPDYSPFYSSPGFQFSLGLGNQAIQRQASANGSLYTPNELAMLSQYNTGYASQNYNNYIGQLMQSAGLGAQGNAGLAQGMTSTGANISQLQQNQGNARASGSANTSGIISNLLGKLPWGSIASGIGGGLKSLGGGGGVSDPSQTARMNWLNGDGGSAVVDQWNNSPGGGISGNTPDFTGMTDPTMQDVGMPDTSNWDTGNINWGDNSDSGSFSSAGGQAAEPTLSNFQSTNNAAFDSYQNSQPSSVNGGGATSSYLGNLGSGLSLAGGAAGIYQGINSGRPQGYASAGISGTKLLSGNQYTKSAFGDNASSINKAAGVAGNLFGIYNGIQQGGVAGYGGAVANGAQLAGTALGNTALSTAGGYIAAPLAVYNFANNWKSGATGSDAANGAAAGAAIGSVVPVIGTAVGAVIGGAVGALSSAFGGGAVDPESSGVQSVIDATSKAGNNPAVAASMQNPYLGMAGILDRHHSDVPIYSQYGRMGEQKFTTDMVSKMNDALQKDPSLAKDPSAMYSKVIQPWVQGMGDWNKVGDAYQATTFGLIQGMVGQYLNGTAAQNWKAIGGDSPFTNIYKGSSVAQKDDPTTSFISKVSSNTMLGGHGPRQKL